MIATDNPYCLHDEAGQCDNGEPCQPPAHYEDCYFCGTPTDTYAIEEDPSVGYKGRVYYCEQCENKVY